MEIKGGNSISVIGMTSFKQICGFTDTAGSIYFESEKYKADTIFTWQMRALEFHVGAQQLDWSPVECTRMS